MVAVFEIYVNCEKKQKENKSKLKNWKMMFQISVIFGFPS